MRNRKVKSLLTTFLKIVDVSFDSDSQTLISWLPPELHSIEAAARSDLSHICQEVAYCWALCNEWSGVWYFPTIASVWTVVPTRIIENLKITRLKRDQRDFQLHFRNPYSCYKLSEFLCLNLRWEIPKIFHTQPKWAMHEGFVKMIQHLYMNYRCVMFIIIH